MISGSIQSAPRAPQAQSTKTTRSSARSTLSERRSEWTSPVPRADCGKCPSISTSRSRCRRAHASRSSGGSPAASRRQPAHPSVCCPPQSSSSGGAGIRPRAAVAASTARRSAADHGRAGGTPSISSKPRATQLPAVTRNSGRAAGTPAGNTDATAHSRSCRAAVVGSLRRSAAFTKQRPAAERNRTVMPGEKPPHSVRQPVTSPSGRRTQPGRPRPPIGRTGRTALAGGSATPHRHARRQGPARPAG